MDKCIGNRGVHEFEARYDEVPIFGNVDIDGKILKRKDLRELLIYKVYVKDVCIHCGAEIKKGKS